MISNAMKCPIFWPLIFTSKGILGDGVAASTRSDPQAKTLGEYLRAKIVQMPAAIVPIRD